MHQSIVENYFLEISKSSTKRTKVNGSKAKIGAFGNILISSHCSVAFQHQIYLCSWSLKHVNNGCRFISLNCRHKTSVVLLLLLLLLLLLHILPQLKCFHFSFFSLVQSIIENDRRIVFHRMYRAHSSTKENHCT